MLNFYYNLIQIFRDLLPVQVASLTKKIRAKATEALLTVTFDKQQKFINKPAHYLCTYRSKIVKCSKFFKAI